MQSLMAQMFAFFDISSFRDNDQIASDNIFEVAQVGKTEKITSSSNSLFE
jgi:hypothetical protein